MPRDIKTKAASTAIIPVAAGSVVAGTTTELETSIQGISAPLAGFLGSLGLPTERVLVDFGERRFVLQSLQQTLDVLPYEEREKAYYLSKFSVAIAVGPFDAALTFLWDETILALRRLAASIDLSYFFDTAEKRFLEFCDDRDLSQRSFGLCQQNVDRSAHMDILRRQDDGLSVSRPLASASEKLRRGSV